MKSKLRSYQYKFSYLLFALLFVFFLFADFGVTSLSDSAIITAIGVENGENDEYKLSFVLAEMKNDMQENRVVEVSAQTVAGGVNQLASQLGMTAKLSYAGLVLVESEVAKGDIFNVISFFLNTSGVHDSASLMICDNPPAEIFRCKLETGKDGIDGLSSLLKTADKQPISIPRVNLKDFAENYFTAGKDNAVACVSLEEQGEKQSLNIKSGYLFSGGKTVEKIENGEILAYNLLSKKGENASFTIDDIDLGNTVSDLRLKIVSADCKLDKIMPKDPILNINCNVKVALLDQNNSQKSLAQICGLATAKEEIAQGVESYIKQNIQSLMGKSFKNNSDFLGIGEKLSRANKKLRKEFEENPNYLQNAKINLQVKAEVLQSGAL